MNEIGKLLMLGGAAFFVVGAIFFVGAKFGLGRLPGDIAFSRGNTSVFIPIVSCLVISVVLTVVVNLVLRFFR